MVCCSDVVSGLFARGALLVAIYPCHTPPRPLTTLQTPRLFAAAVAIVFNDILVVDDELIVF